MATVVEGPRLHDIELEKAKPSIIITGASGFIGRFCVEALKSSFQVHAIRRDKLMPVSKSEGVTWHELDLLDYNLEAIEALFRSTKPDIMLHLAWYCDPTDYKTSLENMRWMDSSARLFELFYALGGQTIIGVGSCFEYFSKSGQFLEGSAAFDPINLYAKAKYSTSLVGLNLAEKFNRKFSWARVFYVYGPNEFPTRVIPTLIDSLLLKKELKLKSYGHQLLDYLYVEDVAGALQALAEYAMHGIVIPYIDVGSGNPISLSVLVWYLSKLLGTKDCIGFTEVEPTDPLVVLAKNQELVSLGWRPKFGLEEGLNKAIEFRRMALGL